MAKPNYSFEKRQRELAKKRKKEDKAARKANPQPGGDAHEDGAAPDDAQNPGDTQPVVIQPVP
ncbi:MAG TPA: hypothetical protein VIW70_02835 [Rubrivivax sp.]